MSWTVEIGFQDFWIETEWASEYIEINLHVQIRMSISDSQFDNLLQCNSRINDTSGARSKSVVASWSSNMPYYTTDKLIMIKSCWTFYLLFHYFQPGF